jgi:hypothetical protein
VAEDDDEDLELGVELVEGRAAGRIAFGKIEALTLQGTEIPRTALAEALVPGTSVERRGRAWHMGRVGDEGRSIVGRIGFTAGNVAELWDEQRKDFREEVVPAGTTSPFAIDVPTLRVAFQVRPRLIPPKSFCGALQGLMNKTSPHDRWRVSQELEELPFDAWVNTVDRVVSMHVRVLRPNPHYGDRKRVEDLIEGANARMAELVWKADLDALDGIDVDDPFVREAVEHSEHYGGYSATGERQGKTTQWVSENEAAAEHRELEADPRTREVPTAGLREMLGDVEPPTPPDEPVEDT